MPGPYSSRGSIDDALALAPQSRDQIVSRSRSRMRSTPSRPSSAEIFAGLREDATEENMQAACAA